MEVVSTLNLIFSEILKATTGCNFQIMNCFAMLRDLMRNVIGSHKNEMLLIFSFVMGEL